MVNLSTEQSAWESNQYQRWGGTLVQHKNQKICVEWMHEGQAKECKDVRKEEYNHDLSEQKKKEMNC